MEKKRIIIVDTTSDSFLILKAMFPAYDIHLAADLSEMIELLIEHKKHIALMILNCDALPDSHWNLALKRLSTFFPNIRLMACTQSAEKQIQIKHYAIDSILDELIVHKESVFNAISNALTKIVRP